MTAYIALLRGINLGRSRRVAMADLRAVLGRAGYDGVRTHLQSGNVLLRSDAVPQQLERDLVALLGSELGMEIPVLVRSRDELAATVGLDPFASEADDPAHYVVHFLGGEPDPAGVRELEQAAVPPERFVVNDREAYSWHPGGQARSGLAGLITDRRLGVQVTARNWRTVTKLLELADAS